MRLILATHPTAASSLTTSALTGVGAVVTVVVLCAEDSAIGEMICIESLSQLHSTGVARDSSAPLISVVRDSEEVSVITDVEAERGRKDVGASEGEISGSDVKIFEGSWCCEIRSDAWGSAWPASVCAGAGSGEVVSISYDNISPFSTLGVASPPSSENAGGALDLCTIGDTGSISISIL